MSLPLPTLPTGPPALREAAFLRQRYRAMLAAIGLILTPIGALHLVPLLAIGAGNVASPEPAWAFAVPGVALIGVGLALRALGHQTAATLTTAEGGVVVVAGWATACLVSALPLVATLHLPYPLALFEAVSGWTTTGLSVVDVATAGPASLLWRSTMQLAGGAGLAVIAMSAIVGPVGVGIATAEGRSDQLAPHVRRSARLVLSVYGAYAAAGVIGYRLAGMDWFDAVNHAFAAASTGGFSTHPESIGTWDSPAVEAVTLPLMVLGNLSFVTAWCLWRGDLRAVSRNGEVRLSAIALPVAAALLFLGLSAVYPHLSKALRVAIFESTTALTTTGFSTVGYASWQPLGIFVLIGLMLIGGGTCSTAGGLKQHRVHLLWRLLVWELRRATLPPAVRFSRPLWEGSHRVFVDDGHIRQLAFFVTLYMALYSAGTAVLCACGFPLRDSLFEYASAIGTVGLSIGVTSASMPAPALWAEMIAMFLGRLEIVIVITSVARFGADVHRMTQAGA